MSFCTKCGARIALNTKFCTKCGAKVEAEKKLKIEKKEPVISKPKPSIEIPKKPRRPFKFVLPKFRLDLGIVLIIAGAIMVVAAMLLILKPWEGMSIKKRDSRRLADIAQIRVALELYYADRAYYPYTYTSTPTAIGGKCLCSDDFKDSCSGYNIVYMLQVPSNPLPRTDGDCPDKDYIYEPSEDGQSYVLKYCLGTGSGSISAGQHQATPGGVASP